MEEVYNIGKFLEKPEYDDLYVKFIYDKKSNTVIEKIYKIVDGNEISKDFSFVINHNGHQINIDGFLSLRDALTGRISLIEVLERAEKSNKTILGYIGKNLQEKIFLIKCKKCGDEHNRYMRFFNGCKGCQTIAKRKKFSDFVSISRIKHNDKYIYNDEGYEDGESKINIFCTKCQRNFSQKVKHHLDGNGCPFCNESKGEIAIEKYLKKHGIRFVRFKKFDGLVHKTALNYDFYLIDLNILIEFDGEHHFKVVNYSKDPAKNLEKFELTKLRDKIKNDYAISNNIPLLRIPYWDFARLEEIIEAFISKHTKNREVKQLELDI